MERYVIRDDHTGFDRLDVLNRVHGPQTVDLLDRVGIQPGWSCLDLGCGSGAVTRELARRVGPTGRVLGIDADDSVLEVARETTESDGLDNVEFRRLSAYDVASLGSYDVVYSRLLLHHLAKPREVLQGMWSVVRPGGLLVVEDADFDGVFCEPPHEDVSRLAGWYAALLERTGGDARNGAKLYRYFRALGIPDVQFRVVQVAYAEGDEKALRLLTSQAISGELLREGVATADEIERAHEAVADYTDDPETILGAPRVFQVWATK